MNEERRRRFWQIHLSTAIILMFVAGLFLALNIATPAIEVLKGQGYFVDGAYVGTTLTRVRYGWPARCYDLHSYDQSKTVSFGLLSSPGGLIVNVFCFVAILSVVAIVCEWMIRRREARSV